MPPSDSTLTDTPDRRQQLDSGWLESESWADLSMQAERYALSLVRSWSDAEEIVQEAFCRLIQRGDLATEINKAVLFKTVRNLSIDLLRRKGRLKFESISEWNTPVEKKHNDDVRLQMLQQAVDQILGKLPDHWSAALNLKVNGGLGYEEISAVLGATKDQVRIWIYRARKRLHHELSQHDPGGKP